MAGLLRRLARAGGVALETVGAAGLDAKNRKLDDQRLTRLEKLRQAGQMAQVERRGELQIEAAGVSEIRRQTAVEEERTYEREVKDPATLAARKSEITHRLEEEHRIEFGDANELLKERKFDAAAEDIFNSAHSYIWFDDLDMDRWGGNKKRAKAEISDKLESGWSQTDVYTWLDSPEYEPTGSSGGTGSSQLDGILSDKVTAGVTEKDVLEQILATPQLNKLHSEAQRRLGQL